MRRISKSFCQVDHLELRRLLSTIYVSSAATAGTNDGTSWTNAYTDLQSALSVAGSGDSIEVGQGTYNPTSGTDRTISFDLITGVAIYGGYAGTGQSNPDARDVSAYPTILSGDIGTQGDNSDNTYYVVRGSGTDSTAVLDGFTVTGGNSDRPNGGDVGGGIDDGDSSPTINDCIITGNNAEFGGGGIYSNNSNAILINSTISGNTAGTSGGGMYDRYSTLTIEHCIITQNTSNSSGGGILNNQDTSDTLIDCTITGNWAAFDGGGIDNLSTSASLTNCVIAGNTAGQNGGAINIAGAAPVIVNCTISGNSAVNDGGGIYVKASGTPTVTNSILWGDMVAANVDEIGSTSDSSATINFSDVDGGFAGTGNIDADPLFVDAANGNYRLQDASSAINAGSNSAVPDGITTDIAGDQRIVGSAVDLGAFELQSSKLVISAQPPANATAGNAFSVVVEITDDNGNVITTDNSDVTVSIGSGPSGASVGGTLTVTAVDGVATFSDLTLNRAGDNTLAFADGSLAGTTSNTIATTYAGPQLVFDSEPTTTTAGAKFGPVTVETDDASGTLVTGDKPKITLTLSSGDKIYGSTKATVNKNTGIATFKHLAIHNAGTYTLTAIDASDSNFADGQSVNFTVNAAAPKKLKFTSQPTTAITNNPFSVSVELLDKYGNPTGDGSTVDLVLGSHPRTATSLNLTQTISNGSADFDQVTLNVAGNYTLKASVGKAKARSKKIAVSGVF
ncbi:MAG TPA: right-handed parallel beta-helix repeat-containing protein [Tepidisphaeraceae bacterium]|nr:right-handed parallel beta-helix repeat-containing protein [Tepidisphaeraceae bacterium]